MDADQIVINDLEISCCIGVDENERARPQRLAVTIEMQTDCAMAARADEVGFATDYARVAEDVKQLAASHPRKLVETLAEEIARLVLEQHMVPRVTVEVEKFPFKDARSVAVKITRYKHAS